MKTISVIVPCFKRVEQTIKTLKLIQSSKDLDDFSLEIIVADCTPDESLKNAILAKFGLDIVYVRPERPGISTNKNKGAEVAKGEILIFCDSDIEVQEGTIRETIDYLAKNKVAAAVMGNVIWKGGERNGQKDRLRPEDRKYTFNGFIAVEAIYSRYIATYKDIFMQVGGNDEQVFNMRGEGSDLSIRYWKSGYPLFYDPNITVFHVYDAPDSAALRVSNPKKGIAKDLLLLAYKYDMLNQIYPNFLHTLAANFGKVDNENWIKSLDEIADTAEEIAEAKKVIDKEKKDYLYPFKFLEVFSDKNSLEKCLQRAGERISQARRKAFENE